MFQPALKLLLKRLYRTYNHRKWVHPDPLEFLYGYSEPQEREVAGLLASSLAYGRVKQILNSVEWVLSRMGPSPRGFLKGTSSSGIETAFRGFRHRFSTDRELILLLKGVRRVIQEYGSIYECFRYGFSRRDENILPALSFLVEQLRESSNGGFNSLLSVPSKGSACKRLNLFLRWMVRKDRVDPGGWDGISPSKLIVPMDIHMTRVALLLGLTKRRNPNMAAALEVTRSFGEIEPGDPVRYDFALTRLGIRGDLDTGCLPTPS